MPHDPYAEPSALTPLEPPEPGEVVVGESLFDAWLALQESWEVGILGFLLSGALTFVSVCTCFGAFLLAPVVSWGYTALLLNTVDGDAEVDDVLGGFGRFGEALPRMLTYYLSMLVGGVGVAAAAAAIAAFAPASVAPVLFTLLLAGGFGAAARLLLAPYYIVDQGMGGLEAMQAAWQATRRQEVTMFLVLLLACVVGGMGLLLLGFGVLLTLPVAHLVFAAAYRQLEPLDDDPLALQRLDDDPLALEPPAETGRALPSPAPDAPPSDDQLR